MSRKDKILNTVTKKPAPSVIRKTYIGRLVLRCLIFLACVWLLGVHPEELDILQGWNFFRRLSPLHLLWCVWMLDMLWQLIPVQQKLALGSQKLFHFRFQPITEAINYKALHRYIVDTTKSAYKGFLLWTGVIVLLTLLRYWNDLTDPALFMITVSFYVCDLICVLIWCPFRLIMKNRCCTTFRIFNWDHMMIFTPMLFVRGFFSLSLILMSIAVWLVWELCVMMCPERFWEVSKTALSCANCTDKLCTQYCQKLR